LTENAAAFVADVDVDVVVLNESAVAFVVVFVQKK
jgi:hypothetical protein